MLGPIRRRRHSDPDYDVPRPHGSLLHLLSSNRMLSHSSDNSQSGQESDVIEATRFFGETDLTSTSACSRYLVFAFKDLDRSMEYFLQVYACNLLCMNLWCVTIIFVWQRQNIFN